MGKSSIELKGFLFLSALFLLCFLPVRKNMVWQLKQDSLVQIPASEVPNLFKKVVPLMQADFDQDGVEECLNLKNKRAVISDCHGKILWQSPETWQVRQAQITDLNGDGLPEATLLVWRPFQPWPIDRDDPSGGRIKDFHDRAGQSCHLILIHWAKGSYRELWAGSALIRPVSQIQVADIDGDGRQELVALEGYYDSPFSGGTLTVWRWRGFGFVLVDKKEFDFSAVEVRISDQMNWIFTR